MKLSKEAVTNQTKAVIYCRVSSAAQVAKGHGIASQETRCREFARMKNYGVVDVFKDEAVSGGIIDRPGMLSMLAYLKKHKRSGEHVVIIDDISRLARDIKAHLDLRDAISDAGGRLESPSIEFGTDSDSVLVENLLASVSQHQRQKNTEQTVNRMRARLMNGYWPFIGTLGYKFEKRDGEGKVLVRDEPVASIIQEALEGFASGHFQTQAEVKRFLESQPAFPNVNNGAVYNEYVNRLLNRVIYAGYVERPEWGISLRPGRHEGLITLETFQKIQTRLNEGAKVPARADISADFPLRGFVLCGDCGGPLTSCWSTSKTGKKHPYYLCHNKDCDGHRKSIRRADLEGQFEALLEGIQPERGLFEIARAMFKDAWEQRRSQTAAIRAGVRKGIDKAERQIAQLLDRIVEASNPRVIAAYEGRIADLEREKLVLAERLDTGGRSQRPFEEMFELALGFLASPCNLWNSGQLADRRCALNLAFSDRLTYCRKEGFRTPQTSFIFKALEGIGTGNFRMADREGFEPSVRLNSVRRFSKPLVSATHPPVRNAPRERRSSLRQGWPTDPNA